MISEKEWRERYYREVENMTKYYEELNRGSPVIIKKINIDNEFKSCKKTNIFELRLKDNEDN